MTPEQAKRLLPVIQAFAEGKKVQWRPSGRSLWSTVNTPSFHPDHEWRVEPEKIVRWLNLYGNSENPVAGGFYDSKFEADQFAEPSRIACIRIEFEEGEGL
jgi:hypothetical protein